MRASLIFCAAGVVDAGGAGDAAGDGGRGVVLVVRSLHQRHLDVDMVAAAAAAAALLHAAAHPFAGRRHLPLALISRRCSPLARAPTAAG
jgi:hypothetical protein